MSMYNTVKLHIEKAGLQTTIQDAGRWGYQHLGIPVGGAMDRIAAHKANWLVGNPADTPVLEMTLIGPRLRIAGDCQIAITGAKLIPYIEGYELPMNATLTIKDGASLSFGPMKKGCRAYLAVGGQWVLPKWLGSYSTAITDPEIWTKEQLVQAGSTIKVVTGKSISGRQLSAVDQEDWDLATPIRVLPGPEFTQFTHQAVGYFFSQTYRISPASNRMGYRLNPAIPNYQTAFQMISSGVLPGTIQIATGGTAILLMADAQTTGGYPRLAQVISADMDRLGQARPGDEITFRLVDQEVATAAWST